MKHIHHILPQYLGGTDDPSNLIELTVEAHAEAHRLLYEQHSNWQDYCAWQALSGQIGQDEAMFIARSKGGKKPMSEESKAKLRASCKLRTERQRANGVLEAANKKRAESMKGIVRTPQHIANWVESRKGHIVTEEHREKTRQSLAKTRANKKALPK